MKQYIYSLIGIHLLILISCKKDCPDDMNACGNQISIDWSSLKQEATPYTLEVSPLLPDPIPYIPEANPLTEEGIQLGRKLFYDPILSADSTLACAGCHALDVAFTDSGKRFSTGVRNITGKRNAMALVNLVYDDRLFWDGAAESLEAQALEPVPNHEEMDLPWEDAVCRLMNHETYRKDFYEAFGIQTITKEDVAKAIAQFERTLVSGYSEFDQSSIPGTGVFPGDLAAAGKKIFETEEGDCFHCHSITLNLFTDHRFHNNGLTAAETLDDYPDKGLGAITGNPQDNGFFRTPTLRNIALTAPYMHDGRFNTLDEVIDHYSEGIKLGPNVDPIVATKFKDGLRLTDYQKEALKAFLESLTDTGFVNNPNFKSPFE